MYVDSFDETIWIVVTQYCKIYILQHIYNIQ